MRGRNRKGQLVFEFIIAAIFFFYIVFYVISYLNTTAAVFANDFYINSLEFKALQTSETLLHNEGIWNGSEPIVMGLAVDWPVLNATKIQYMETYCSANYETVLNKLDINSSRGHGVRIEVNNTIGNLMDCGFLPDGFVNARIDRFALSDGGEYLTMIVWVW